MANLLVTKYNAIDDAKSALGEIGEIRDTFIGFQKYLYDDVVNNDYYSEDELLMVADDGEPYGTI